jgi:hypothetical protein
MGTEIGGRIVGRQTVILALLFYAVKQVWLDVSVTTAGFFFTALGVAATYIASRINAKSTHAATGAFQWTTPRHHSDCHASHNQTNEHKTNQEKSH